MTNKNFAQILFLLMCGMVFLPLAESFAANTNYTNLKDVETLMDEPEKYKDHQIKVSGESKDRVGDHSFMLESGGIINDEVLVVMKKDMQSEALSMIKEDAEVVITGTVRMIPIVEIEREIGWNFEPELRAEFGDVKTYIVADSIGRK